MNMQQKIKIIFEIDPYPKPRMTRSDKWKKRPCVVRYFNYANMLKWMAKSKKYKVSVPLSIKFEIPMPKSWRKKKRSEMLGQPHKQKPDLSNLIKAFEDALCDDDSHIYEYGSMKKIWAESGRVIVYE